MILAAPLSIDLTTILTDTPLQFSNSITLILFLSSISIIPFFLISVTCFMRITIVLGLLRSAMGTQQSPPNMIIISLALFMTIFIMSPVWDEINDNALRPYFDGKIKQSIAIEKALKPIRTFMFKQVSENDLALFVEFADMDFATIKNRDDIPTHILIPSFMISELKKAFTIAFVIYLPFVLIDLISLNSFNAALAKIDHFFSHLKTFGFYFIIIDSI